MKAFSRHLAWLAQLFQRRAEAAGDPGAAVGPQPFAVAIAPIDGDVEHAARQRLVQALEGRKGLLVRPAAEAPVLEKAEGAAPFAAAAAQARRILAAEKADLLIWGAAAGRGIELFMTPAGEEGRWVHLGLGARLELPSGIDGQAPDLLHALALATVEPRNDAQRALLDELLRSATAVVEALLRRLPSGLTPRQQASVLSACGRVAAAMAAAAPDGDWLGRAETAYATALARLPTRDRTALDDVLPPRQRAALLSLRSEHSGEDADREAAIAAWREAVEALPRAAFPVDWAEDHNRLGLALYRFDLKAGRTDLLKQAVADFQAALQVHTRAEQPRRWAEVVNNLAQALQVYGDAIRSVEVLDKAVEACRAVLEVRTRETDPLGRAAALNTLGTALFLRDKHADESAHLDEAAETLQAAAEEYRALGLEKLAGLAEKNRGHVERLAKDRADRRARFDWAED